MPRKSSEDKAQEEQDRAELDAELSSLVRMGVDRLRRRGGNEVDIAFFEKTWVAAARAVKSSKDVLVLSGAILSTESKVREMSLERGK